MEKPKLEILMVPPSSWGYTLANTLEKSKWDKIRREVYNEAGYKCELCGNYKEELHCHEHWIWNDKKGTQTLDRLICVCKTCHDCIHIRRSQTIYKPKYIKHLINHILKVNNWKIEDLEYYLKKLDTEFEGRKNKHYIVIVGKRRLV